MRTRRDVIQGMLVGATALTAAGTSQAGPTDPNAGSAVGTRPLGPIEPSGIAVELLDVAQLPRTGAGHNNHTNHTFHDLNDANYVYSVDGRGKIFRVDLRSGAVHLFFNLKAARSAYFHHEYLFDGLRCFAFHPNFNKVGRPGYNKIYTSHSEALTSPVPTGVKVFTGPFTASYYYSVVSEWSVFATDRSRVDPRSQRELFRTTSWKYEHPLDQLLFDPNIAPESEETRYMLVGIGDGGNGIAHQNDAIFGMPQDPSVVLGKILRINPAYTTNGARYGIPSSNPFYNRAGANRAVWALGLRHHQVMSFDSGGTKQLYIGAIGQNLVESIYQGRSGANYGWPNREGRFVTDRSNTNRLYNLPSPSIDATRGYTYPVAQYDHSNGIALAGGYVYRGQDIPELYGHYICGDISSGKVFHFSVDALVPGQSAVMNELTLLRSGQPVKFREFVGGRPDLRFGQTRTGDVLLSTKRLGRLWKLGKA